MSKPKIIIITATNGFAIKLIKFGSSGEISAIIVPKVALKNNLHFFAFSFAKLLTVSKISVSIIKLSIITSSTQTTILHTKSVSKLQNFFQAKRKYKIAHFC